MKIKHLLASFWLLYSGDVKLRKQNKHKALEQLLANSTRFAECVASRPVYYNRQINVKLETLRKIVHVPVTVVRCALHFTLAVWYRGKGKVLPSVGNPLLLKSATKLARDIREGKCKSEDVILAYIGRILEVEPYINATADCCFEDALLKSREVDALIASCKYTKEQLSIEKPLLGVPISVKSSIHVKGMPCSGGCSYLADLRAIENAPAIAAVKNAGAILITTTNVPELSMDIETYNRIYGRTRNPYDTNRTCGGSSGGEAALIGAGASVLGLGTDLLGSLRIPAHFSGVFSHKPSRGLVCHYGTFPFERPDVPGDLSSPEVYKYLVVGPMCRYAEDLVTSMKVLTSDEEVRTKFDHRVDFRKIKIYYLTEILSPLLVPVDKEIAAALKNAVSYFGKIYNVTPKEVQMPYLSDLNRCMITVMEPVYRELKYKTIGSNGIGLNVKLECLKYMLGKSKLCSSTLFKLGCFSNPLFYKKDQISFYQKMADNWMEKFHRLLDEDAVLLMPTFPVPAPYHLETTPLLPSVCYTALFNVLGLPATHCPLGFTHNGLPYGIQIVGRHNNDSLTIACAVELEKAFGGWKSYSKYNWV